MSFKKYTPKELYAQGIHFHTVEELLNEDYSLERLDPYSYRSVELLSKEPPDWFGLPESTRQEDIAPTIERYAREGSPEIAAHIENCFREMRNAVKITAVRRKKVKTMSDFGTEVHMDRIYAGDMDKAWRSSRRVMVQANTPPKRIVIAVPLGGLCNVPAEELFWQGATACFLAQELMTAGYSVGIVGYSASYGCNADWRGGHYIVSVTVKEMHRKANMAAIAGCLGCPGFFRWLLLRARALQGYRVARNFGWTAYARGLPPEALDRQAQILQMPVVRSLHQARHYLTTAVEELHVGAAA